MSRNTYYLAPHHRLPRDAVWLLISIILLIVIWRIAPQQLPIVPYKLCLVTLAASVGFWLDRTFFPYARPDSYLNDDWRLGTDEPIGDVDFRIVNGYHHVFAAAMLRRAMIVAASIIGVTLGL
jgi:hypothetical protein